MEILVTIPTLIAAWIAWNRGFREAFAWCVLPALLLTPQYVVFDLPAMPAIDFHNFPMLVALIALGSGRDRRLMHWHWIDALVLALIVLGGIATGQSQDGAAARNHVAVQCMSVLAPYLIGKALTADNGLLAGTVSTILALLTFVGFMSLWETRMSQNLFVSWSPLVKGAARDGGGMPILFRSGVMRAGGPFHHPIFMGMVYCLVCPLAAWAATIKLPRALPVRALLVTGCALGLVLPLSRGPLLGGMIAAVIAGAGWTRYRRLLLGFGLLCAIGAGWYAYRAALPYWDFTVEECYKLGSETQQNAVYRVLLLSLYPPIVMQSPWVGFGHDAIPVIEGLESIDNEYLYQALCLGIPYAATFFVILLAVPLLLIRRLLSRARLDVFGRLGWCVAGGLIGFGVTCLTVITGGQVPYVLWLVIGIGVGLLRRLRLEPIAALEAQPRPIAAVAAA